MKGLYKKDQYSDRFCKCNKNIRNHYGGHLSGLEEGPNDVVCQEDGSHCPVAEFWTNVQKNDEYLSDRSSSFETKFAGIFSSFEERRPTDCFGSGLFVD